MLHPAACRGKPLPRLLTTSGELHGSQIQRQCQCQRQEHGARFALLHPGSQHQEKTKAGREKNHTKSHCTVCTNIIPQRVVPRWVTRCRAPLSVLLGVQLQLHVQLHHFQSPPAAPVWRSVCWVGSRVILSLDDALTNDSSAECEARRSFRPRHLLHWKCPRLHIHTNMPFEECA